MRLLKTISTFLILADMLLLLTACSQQEESLIAGKFRDNGDGTLTHVARNLVWMRCQLGQQWTGESCEGTALKLTWAEAVEAAREIPVDGSDHWRLPSVDEFFWTMVTCAHGASCWTGENNFTLEAFVSELFPQPGRGYFEVWTSDDDIYFSYSGFSGVRFYLRPGRKYGPEDVEQNRVWLVRDGGR